MIWCSVTPNDFRLQIFNLSSKISCPIWRSGGTLKIWERVTSTRIPVPRSEGSFVIKPNFSSLWNGIFNALKCLILYRIAAKVFPWNFSTRSSVPLLSSSNPNLVLSLQRISYLTLSFRGISTPGSKFLANDIVIFSMNSHSKSGVLPRSNGFK